MKEHRQSSTKPAAESTIESLKLRADGQQAHYLKAGSGPSVVLLHGGASNSRDWVETMDALSHSYSLHAPDMLGYGLSDRLKSGYHLSEFVDFVLEFIKKLNFDTHVLVGHSLGGRVCLEIALRYPEIVRRLVLVDTAGFSRLARWGMYMGAFMYWLRKILHITQPYPRFLKEDGKDKDWLCAERLPELKVPTLVIWNQRDPYYPISGAFEAMELIPNARLEVFQGYGHTPHVQQRDNFNSLLLDFLNDG